MVGVLGYVAPLADDLHATVVAGPAFCRPPQKGASLVLPLRPLRRPYALLASPLHLFIARGHICKRGASA